MIATVDVVVTGVADDDVVTVDMREFPTADAEGTTIGLVSATGDGEGTARISEQLAVSADAAYLAVSVAVDGLPVGACEPSGSDRAGCTVVALPASLSEGRRPVVVSALPTGATATSSSTTHRGAHGGPSPTAAPTTTVSPSPTASPS